MREANGLVLIANSEEGMIYMITTNELFLFWQMNVKSFWLVYWSFFCVECCGSFIKAWMDADMNYQEGNNFHSSMVIGKPKPLHAIYSITFVDSWSYYTTECLCWFILVERWKFSDLNDVMSDFDMLDVITIWRIWKKCGINFQCMMSNFRPNNLFISTFW